MGRFGSSVLSLLLILFIFAPTSPGRAQDSTPTSQGSLTGAFDFYPKGGEWGDYFDVTLEPGSTTEYAVILANTGDTPFDFVTYPINAFTKDGGGFAAAEYGTPPNDVTNWLDFPEEAFSLEVGTGVEKSFTITVPEETAPGEYLTAVAASHAQARGIEGTENLQQVTRFVLPVLITVPGPTTTEFAVGTVTLATNADMMQIQISLINTGDVRVKPKGTIDLVGEDGSLIASVPVAMESIYARDSTTLTIAIPGSIPAGTYQVNVDLTDPASGVTATTEATDLLFSGSGSEATTPDIVIESAVVQPAPSADDVQFAMVEAVIANYGEPVANAQLSLIARVNGEEVDRFAISQSLSLPTGDTPVSTRYIPITGWTSGTWTFELLLETVESSGAAVVVGRQPVEGTITIP